MEELRNAIHKYFGPHRHSALLLAIIAAFAVRPLIGDSADASLLFGFALVLLLIVALYNINVDELVGERGRLVAQTRRRRIIGWTLATGAAAERIVIIFVHSRTVNLVGTFFWFLFIVYVTVSELRSVLKQKEVSGETICMATSVYLLMGFSWAFLYAIIYQRHPEAFGGLPAVQLNNVTPVFPILGYFSLTTLSTIGFGDITPLTLQARYAAVAEGITGQFYLAILVARLVGMQMTQATVQPTKSDE